MYKTLNGLSLKTNGNSLKDVLLVYLHHKKMKL